MLWGILLGNISLGSIIGMIAMAPGILFAIIGARYIGKSGSRDATVRWTWICIVLAALAIAFCLVAPMGSVLSTLPLAICFFALWLLIAGAKMVVTVASGAMRADIVDYELDRSGKYLPGVVTATYNFIDQFITSLSATIALGSVALIGYAETMPQPTDAATPAILYLTVGLIFGFPILGWVCTLFAMHGYKLDRQEMIAVQKRIADQKAALQQAELAAAAALVTAEP
jgi:Na+/melibiose symporter-like transporter